ncbi:MAG: hypothetical protein K6F51_02395 [Acetatifactor sp.]|nr:hypothetical protein [Acetatifactor sp.]
MKKRFYGVLITILCIVFASACWEKRVSAQETSGEEAGPDNLLIMTRSSTIVINDPEDLLRMADAPGDVYDLACDIDMAGIEWKPFAFHGVLNGRGYSILNLTISQTGDAVRETYDGNMKVYDTYFAGMFDELSGLICQISDLNLVNLRIDVETDEPCFIGSFAGYMENARVENCSVQGILQLRAHDRMFGVGGMIGYGCGEIKDCTADVTLTCIDTDASTKDEQFMGGVCAAGYPDLHHNTVAIRGFDSDHGYVHDGGLIGMYMFYPKGKSYRGSITDNYVSGKITFYEDNKNRRAYCNGFIGEIMNWDFENGRNKNDFVRDEVYTYDVDLMPHSCDNPAMREEVVPPGCEFGYTKYVCETCGYEETDHYTLREHDYEWVTEKEATETDWGRKRGVCKDCGAETSELIPKIIPEPTPEPEEQTAETLTETDADDAPKEQSSEVLQEKESLNQRIGENKGWILLISICITGIAVMIVWILWKRSDEKEA